MENYELEQKIVATEVYAYVYADPKNKKTLKQAYEDMGVPKDMQLSMEEINHIMAKYVK